MPSNRNAHSSEEEDLQEAIRRSLRDEGTRPHHAPQDDRHHTSSESRDLQMAINRSLQQLDMPPSRDHDPPLHETPPPPYNPSYHPQTAQGVPESTHIPPQEEPPTGEEEGGVRRRRVPGGVAAGSEVELDAVRAARLRRFETTN